MNKAYKYTLTANEHKEITFDVGVQRLAITNANGTDGGSGVTYTAGDNIQISEENVISATDTTYTAGDGIAISEQNVISNTAEGNTDIIAEEFDSGKEYNIGDYCIHDDKLYRCKTNIEIDFLPFGTITPLGISNPSPNIKAYWGAFKYGSVNAYIIFARDIDNNNSTDGLKSIYTSPFGGSNAIHSGDVARYVYYTANNIYWPNPSEYVKVYDTQQELLTAIGDFTNIDVPSDFQPSEWEEVTVTDEIKSLKVYSNEEERVVGNWIDGRKIYERTIIQSATIPNAWTNYFEISGIDQIISTNAITNNGNVPIKSQYYNGYIQLAIPSYATTQETITHLVVQYLKTP